MKANNAALKYTKVWEIMSRDPITVKPTESLLQACQLMFDNDIRHIIVEDEGVVAGVLSDRDMLCELSLDKQFSEIDPNSVDYIMNADVITLGPHDSVLDAIHLMTEHRIHCVVIVNVRGKPIGIITDFDILTYLGDVSPKADTGPHMLRAPV